MSVNAVTTPPQKISVVRLTGLNSRNIVVFAASILRTEKRGSIKGKPAIYAGEKAYRPVARTVRAPDSKSGGWGFKSLLACFLGGIVILS
jgi:hypothetical protein